MIFADIFFSIIFGLPNAMSGLSDFLGNFIENIIMFLFNNNICSNKKLCGFGEKSKRIK